jgi:hypothetical protein
MSSSRIFLLSPAFCGGKRAALLFSERARFELACRLRESRAAPIGEIFSFLSGLYFRGKLAYSRHFAQPPPGSRPAYVITSNRGLLPVETPITLAELQAFGQVNIDAGDPHYRRPLERDAGQMLQTFGSNCQFVLLGSVASAKYVEVLLEILGDRLLFPADFIGRGDMSRGGLMLRCVEEQRELTYIPVQGAVRRGKRPPKLERRARSG